MEQFLFFFFCVPSYISGVHHSSSAFPATSLGFTILLLRSQLHLWGSPFFFCVPSYISGVHHSSSAFPATSLGFTILLLHSQLHLWGSPFFFCVPSYISGVHYFFFFCNPSYFSWIRHSSSSSAFPAICLGFTILLLLRSQLDLWGSPFVYLTVFNPTIEVVTFRLRGWCMLGVFVDGIHPSRT